MKCKAGLLSCNPQLFELGIDWISSRCKRNNSMTTCNDSRARRKNSRTRRNSYRSSMLGIGVQNVAHKKEFLMQKLPEVPSSSMYPSSCPKGRMSILVRVQPWDVMRKIEDFLQVANSEKYNFDMFPQHFNRNFNAGDESFVTHCL